MRWLNDYVKADMPIKEFVADMTMSGSKVETYHKMSDPINNVVVAKVSSDFCEDLVLRMFGRSWSVTPTAKSCGYASLTQAEKSLCR